MNTELKEQAKEFLRSDIASEFEDVAFTDKQWDAIYTWMVEFSLKVKVTQQAQKPEESFHVKLRALLDKRNTEIEEAFKEKGLPDSVLYSYSLQQMAIDTLKEQLH